MFNFIESIGGYAHFSTILLLLIPLYLLYKFGSSSFLNKLILVLLLFNIISYYGLLLFNDSFDFRVHLPLHLCYFTEIIILMSYILDTRFFYPWIFLNSLGGGISGFLNSIMVDESVPVEYLHHYLSHFNLLLFTIIFLKSKHVISIKELINSIYFNAIIFTFALFFNLKFNSNYWFTMYKPSGDNLSVLFPSWPYYLILFILIGLTSYAVSYQLVKEKSHG